MKPSISLLLLSACLGVNVLAGDLEADLLAREKSMWQGWANRDAGPLRQHSAEDMVSIIAGTGGRVSGLETNAAGFADHGCTLSAFEFSDAALKQVTADVVILSYKASQNAECDGEPLPARLEATAVYVRRNGEWRSTHYQETPIE